MLTVLGQSRALAQLQRSIAAGRLAHTWLFSGPLGVGKFKLAVELARTHLCDHPLQQPNGASVPQLPPDFLLTLPCGTCESCRAIDSGGGAAAGTGGGHPDLHIITKELIRFHDKSGKSKGTTLGIDVIRGEITGDSTSGKEAKIAKRSFRGRGKFFIIDEADLMEPPAQNSLLKTLEEPPPESFLILITTSPQELLSTIRSRSQLLNFAELPDTLIASALLETDSLEKQKAQREAQEKAEKTKERGDQPSVDIPRFEPALRPDDAALLARLARGSLGRAVRWTEDIWIITKTLKESAERAEKKKARTSGGAADDDEESPGKFSPGGILTWTRQLSTQLDQLVSGQSGASAVAATISRYALEYSALQLKRDPLTSADQAKRAGIALMMTIAAEWFADRLRHGIGTPYPALLPAVTGALDLEIVPRLISSARAAEAQIDMNANDKILLAATTTRWEQLLQQSC